MNKRDEKNLAKMWAAIQLAGSILVTLKEKNWITEDPASAEYFPNGGLNLIEEQIKTAVEEMNACFVRYDKIKNPDK